MPTDENRRLHRETLRSAVRYAELNELLNNMNTWLADHAERLGVSGQQVAELKREAKTWSAIYAEYTNPNTRTRAVIMQIEEDYTRINTLVHTVQQQVKNNAKVTLTGDDHTAMGIHLDKPTRTRVPVQTVAPMVENFEMHHLQNRFRTSYPDSAGDFHRRLPAYNQLLHKVAYSATADEPADAAYDHISVSGRSSFTVISPPDTAVGTYGYVKCCYVNSRGETGPDSAPLQFMVN